MHKAKGLYGDGRLPMSSRTRRIASLRLIIIVESYKVGDVDFLVFATHAESKGHLVFYDKFPLLKSGNGSADVV